MYFPLFLPLPAEKREVFYGFTHNLIQEPCGSSLCLFCGVGVDVHGGAYVRVSKKFLNIFRFCVTRKQVAGEMYGNGNSSIFQQLPLLFVKSLLACRRNQRCGFYCALSWDYQSGIIQQRRYYHYWFWTRVFTEWGEVIHISATSANHHINAMDMTKE